MRGSPRHALTREGRRDHRGSDPSAMVWARVEEGSISCLSVSAERAQGFHRMSSPIAVLPSWAGATDVINIYRSFAAASAMQSSSPDPGVTSADVMCAREARASSAAARFTSEHDRGASTQAGQAGAGASELPERGIGELLLHIPRGKVRLTHCLDESERLSELGCQAPLVVTTDPQTTAPRWPVGGKGGDDDGPCGTTVLVTASTYC